MNSLRAPFQRNSFVLARVSSLKSIPTGSVADLAILIVWEITPDGELRLKRSLRQNRQGVARDR